MRTTSRATLSCSCALLAIVATPAQAQDAAAQTGTAPVSATGAAQPAADPAEDTQSAAESGIDNSGEIIVTARRRDESIVDVPLAITVVTAEKLQRLNIKSTADVANFVPGLEFSDFTQGNSRNDRGGNRTIIFRGLNLANIGGGVQQAASMFLDGAMVLGNEIPGSLDIGAVEVLRGPQNVYFGRSTMTGAIAYRTKAIPNEISLDTNIEIAQRDTIRLESSIAGPLIDDLLGFRITGLYEKNDGFITNQYDRSGPKLGARSRRSVSATLDITPTPAFEVKLYGNYFEDEDGPSATVNVFPDAPNAIVTTINAGLPTQRQTLVTPTTVGAISNCIRGENVVINPIASTAAVDGFSVTPARATICGRVPDVSNAFAYSRTDIPANMADLLFGYTPYIKDESFKRQAGLQRHVFNSHAVVNFEVSDYLKAQSITGYHVTTVLQVVDGGAQPIRPASPSSILFFGLANKYKDFSQELRLSSDPERAFSWTIGANYVKARSINQAWNMNQSNIQPTLTNPNPVQTFNGTAGVFSPGDNRSTTYGIFGGAYLKLLQDRMTLSAEARYQIDDRFAQTLSPLTLKPLTTSPSFEEKFKAFSPRVSVDYDVGEGRKVYASYAKGGRPGGFNSALLSFLDPNNSRYGGTNPCNCFAAVQSEINSLFGTVDPAYKQETLTIGELGFKGYLDGSKGFFDINTYYGIVSDQQVTQGQIITALTPPTVLSIIVNTGETEIYGVEFTGNYRFTPALSLDTTFAWNQTKRKEYIDNAPGTIAIYGFSDFSGLQLPFAPRISGSAVLSYERPGTESWAPFANTALVYRGKMFADIGNLAYIPGRATVDFRGGVKNERLRFEAYVTNAFNNKTYPAGNVAPDFGINTVNGTRSQYSGFFGAYANPRTVGLRLSAGL